MEQIRNDALGSAQRLMAELLRLRPALRGPEVTERIRQVLASAERQWALYLLLITDAEITQQVLPELVQAGLRHRDALLVREVIGRLPRPVLVHDLPALLEERTPHADEDEFRRFAELLAHLGLIEALNAMIQRGMESEDPGVREAAEDFSRR